MIDSLLGLSPTDRSRIGSLGGTTKNGPLHPVADAFANGRPVNRQSTDMRGMVAPSNYQVSGLNYIAGPKPVTPLAIKKAKVIDQFRALQQRGKLLTKDQLALVQQARDVVTAEQRKSQIPGLEELESRPAANAAAPAPMPQPAKAGAHIPGLPDAAGASTLTHRHGNAQPAATPTGDGTGGPDERDRPGLARSEEIFRAEHAGVPSGVRTAVPTVRADGIGAAALATKDSSGRLTVQYNPRLLAEMSDWIESQGRDSKKWLKAAAAEEHIHIRDWVSGGQHVDLIRRVFWNSLSPQAVMRRLRDDVTGPVVTSRTQKRDTIKLLRRHVDG